MLAKSDQLTKRQGVTTAVKWKMKRADMERILIVCAAALVVAVILAYLGKSLIVVALSSSAAVLVVEWAMSHL